MQMHAACIQGLHLRLGCRHRMLMLLMKGELNASWWLPYPTTGRVRKACGFGRHAGVVCRPRKNSHPSQQHQSVSCALTVKLRSSYRCLSKHSSCSTGAVVEIGARKDGQAQGPCLCSSYNVAQRTVNAHSHSNDPRIRQHGSNMH